MYIYYGLLSIALIIMYQFNYFSINSIDYRIFDKRNKLKRIILFFNLLMVIVLLLFLLIKPHFFMYSIILNLIIIWIFKKHINKKFRIKIEHIFINHMNILLIFFLSSFTLFSNQIKYFDLNEILKISLNNQIFINTQLNNIMSIYFFIIQIIMLIYPYFNIYLNFKYFREIEKFSKTILSKSNDLFNVIKLYKEVSKKKILTKYSYFNYLIIVLSMILSLFLIYETDWKSIVLENEKFENILNMYELLFTALIIPPVWKLSDSQYIQKRNEIYLKLTILQNFLIDNYQKIQMLEDCIFELRLTNDLINLKHENLSKIYDSLNKNKKFDYIGYYKIKEFIENNFNEYEEINLLKQFLNQFQHILTLKNIKEY